MNVRVFLGIVVTALALTIAELSCVTHDDPVLAHRVSFPTEAPEHDPALDVDAEVSASPVLAR
jgi:hypothetical protein